MKERKRASFWSLYSSDVCSHTPSLSSLYVTLPAHPLLKRERETERVEETARERDSERRDTEQNRERVCFQLPVHCRSSARQHSPIHHHTLSDTFALTIQTADNTFSFPLLPHRPTKSDPKERGEEKEKKTDSIGTEHTQTHTRTAEQTHQLRGWVEAGEGVWRMEWDLSRMESELRHINPDLLQPSKSFKKPSSGTITLNVGGFLYTAHRTTLAKQQGSFLEEVANGKKAVQHTDSMGNPFIDRDGPVFRHVLNYLRTGELQLPDDFREAGLLRREADFYRLTELVEAVVEWETQRAALREPAFLEVTDSHERSQGLKVYCSDPAFIDKVKGRLVQISKSRLDGFPEEFVVSSNVIQFRHFIKSEPGSRLVLKEDSTFLCTLDCLKLETVMLALRSGFKLVTCLDSSKGSVVVAEALHFVK